MRLCLFAVVPVILGLATLAPTRAEDKKEKWVQLFNGKDLTGWKVYPKGTGKWKVEGGAIVGTGNASHLFSERGDYKNFRFRVEAKINDKGNSGQYVRTKFEAGFPTGFEAQINATHGDRVKTGSLYPDGRQKDMRDVKSNIVLKAAHEPDEWFTQEVICVGPKVTILVNGKKSIEWTDPKYRFKQGHFAIQQHDPGSVVHVRKVEVIELPADKE